MLPPACALTGEQVLAYVDGAFRPDAAATLRLRAALAQLVTAPERWSQLAAGHRLAAPLPCEAIHCSAGSLAALQAQVQDQPGDILLLRLDGDRFALLSRHQRSTWVGVAGDGQVAPLADAVDGPFVDAVLLTLPVDDTGTLPRSARGYLRWLIGEAWAEVGVASLLINAGQLLLPLFSMLLYNKIINNGVFATLWALAIGMLIYIVTDAALRAIRAWAVERLARNLTHRDDLRTWQRLADARNEQQVGIAALLSHYRDLAVGREFISSGYLLALADIPFLLFYLAVITLIAWPLGLLTALLAGLYFLVSRELYALLTRAGREAEQAMTRKMAALGSLVGALDLLKSSRKQHFLRRQWITTGNHAQAAEQRRRLLQNAINVAANVVSPLTSVALLVLGAYLVEWRSSNIGALIACSMLASRCMATISSLFTVWTKWDDFERAAARFAADTAAAEADTRMTRVSLPTVQGRLQVLGLSKTYAERPPVLVEVSLQIGPREHVALLGKPGAGKTTLLRALAGLVTPDAGQVLIDSTRIKDIDPDDRSRWLVYKGQEPLIFAGTLMDNLQAERPELLQRGLWLSGLDEDIRLGRLNLATPLLEGGSNLSGGQRQKVALARAFAQSATVYLLDEPSAGLDPDSERQLALRLKQALADATVLMITHSPVLIETVERLLVLDNGRLVADGPKEKYLQPATGNAVQAAAPGGPG